jgi:hypothetical protein
VLQQLESKQRALYMELREHLDNAPQGLHLQMYFPDEPVAQAGGHAVQAPWANQEHSFYEDVANTLMAGYTPMASDSYNVFYMRRIRAFVVYPNLPQFCIPTAAPIDLPANLE